MIKEIMIFKIKFYVKVRFKLSKREDMFNSNMKVIDTDVLTLFSYFLIVIWPPSVILIIKGRLARLYS